LITRLLAWVTVRLLRRQLRDRKKQGEGRRFAIISIAKYTIYTVSILLILTNSGLDITVLVAGSTALLVGLGFGLQNLFKDLVSGVILLFEGSLELNDVVEVNNVVGKVRFIGLRTSKILTQDGIMIIVPNSRFVEEKVINLTNQNEISRFHVKVYAAYGSDPEHVRDVLVEVANAHRNVEEFPSPTVRFTDFADSSLEFELMFWTYKNFTMEDIMSELRFAIFAAFKKHDIQIPFPQQDIYVKEMPDGRPLSPSLSK
ncbi:MAG: mechanosensitive ion channel domain-containing protein, partial [Bacteroidota bacterium]